MLEVTLTAALKALGSAAFFGLIAATILPPSMPLAIYLFALITMGIGMLVGWAWGCAAMASGLHVRSKALLQAQSASAQATFDPNLPSTPQSELWHVKLTERSAPFYL